MKASKKTKSLRPAGIAMMLTAALLLSACDGSIYYDASRSVDEHGWLPSEPVVFDVEVDDTTSYFNFLVGVRNSITYPYSNTFLLIGTTFPDGSIAHDTLECPLADASGRWYGKRTGRYVDSRYRLRGGSARFPMKGNYRFEVGNGMRDSAISGLKDISLRIEYRTTK